MSLEGEDLISSGNFPSPPTLDALGPGPHLNPDSQCGILVLSGPDAGGGEVLGKVCLVIWSFSLQLLGTEKQSADSLEMR